MQLRLWQTTLNSRQRATRTRCVEAGRYCFVAEIAQHRAGFSRAVVATIGSVQNASGTVANTQSMGVSRLCQPTGKRAAGTRHGLGVWGKVANRPEPRPTTRANDYRYQTTIDQLNNRITGTRFYALALHQHREGVAS